MMRQALLAAAAVLALAACNEQTAAGPALPTVQAGAQAPMTQTAPEAPPRQAQITDEVRQQLIANIGEQLDGIGGSVAPGAARPAGFEDRVVTMQPSTDHRFTIDLTGGAQYSFIGACDGDCANVDIELIDMRTGGVVGSDVLPDDYPVVHFAPPANGQYMVRLLMQNCTVAPCYAGARVLQHAAAQATPN